MVQTLARPDEAPDNVAVAETAAAALQVPDRPALVPNVQLCGELQGSGFQDRQWLIERDGRYLQVTELIYRVAELANGERTLDEICAGLAESMGRIVTPAHVRVILLGALIPRGVVQPAPGVVTPRIETVRSPLLVNLRQRMIGPRVLEPVTRVLQWLYAPPVLLAALIAIGFAHWWVYGHQGIVTSLRAALFTPGALITVLLLMLAAGPVHELGHAAALRYGGGRARGIGVGIYLVYPVFYTNATDSYRLGRWARVRTDLGGFYFHLLFAAAMVALAAVSGQPFLQVVLLLVDLAILQDCLPFVRWDGYWALADLTGIPDFLSLTVPFMLSVWPGRGSKPAAKLPPLKPWVKAVFIVYLVSTLPVLTLLFGFMASRVPSIVAAAAEALRFQVQLLPMAWSSGDGLLLFGLVTQTMLLILPLLGLAYSLYAGTRKLGGLIWRLSRPTPLRRVVGGMVTAGLVSGIGYLWVPQLPLDDVLRFTRPAPPAGVQTFAVAERNHVQSSVEYPQTPPVGGNHAPIWQNCGYYESPIINEYGVHSLEHGAVWITYRPDLPADQVAVLSDLADSKSYVLVSPYPDLPAPVVASAWGKQLQLDSADDARLVTFVRAFRNGDQAPEPGAPCSGGIGDPA